MAQATGFRSHIKPLPAGLTGLMLLWSYITQRRSGSTSSLPVQLTCVAVLASGVWSKIDECATSTRIGQRVLPGPGRCPCQVEDLIRWALAWSCSYDGGTTLGLIG